MTWLCVWGLVASTYQCRYQFWDRLHFVIMFFVIMIVLMIKDVFQVPKNKLNKQIGFQVHQNNKRNISLKFEGIQVKEQNQSRVQTWRHFTQFCWLEIMTSKMIC